MDAYRCWASKGDWSFQLRFAALWGSPGDQLHLSLVGHSLVLERPQDAASELRGLAALVPRTRSLVDELLSERRHAAAVGE